MNLRHLQVFHAIMQTGSVTGAARLLNVSQPAISSVLRHCESQLKMKLFIRTGARLVPTPEAEAIFPDVDAIFDRLFSVDQLVKDLAGGVQGTLSIASCFPIANGIMTQAIATFLEQHPGIKTALYSGSSPVVLSQVANREVEMGVAYGPVVHPEIDTELLLRSSIACVIPLDHPLASRQSIDARELTPYPIITYLNQTPMRSYVDRALSNAGVVPNIRSQVAISLSGMMLAKFGAGIALVEPFLLSIQKIPGLIAIPLNPRIEVHTVLLRHKMAPRSRIMTEFCDHLKSLCSDLGEAPMLGTVQTQAEI